MSNTDTQRQKIYLAALLHDIGKFYQRADTGDVKTSKYLSEHVKNLEGVYCPHFKDYYSHKHVLWTAQFIEDFQSIFNNILKEDVDSYEDNLSSIACKHHLPEDQLSSYAYFIKKADQLSSGMDRNSDEAYKDEKDSNNFEQYRKKRMVSIFEGILKDEKTFQYHLPVRSISIDDSEFPRQSFDKAPDYESLWNNFVKEFKLIQAKNIKAFNETLLNLLEKYTTHIPSTTINLPDISLYDHLKTTAAFATSLYTWQNGNEKEEETFLLIGADLSGIQSFIYDIISKKAAKNLKGRSFYVQILIDSILQRLINELDLPVANVIYSSGGGFYVLAPNTKQTKEKFNESRKAIESKIFEKHGTELYIALDYIPISDSVFMNQEDVKLGDKWTELTHKLNANKRKRYVEEIDNNFEYFFKPSGSGGLYPKDAITQEEFTKEGIKNVIDYDTGGKVEPSKVGNIENPVNLLTYKQIQLGDKLKKAAYWVSSDYKIDYWSENEGFEPANLGIWHYFLSEEDIKSKQEELKNSADSVRIFLLNNDKYGNCDFLDPSFKGNTNIYGLSFYGGNEFPQDKEGNPKLFDELAGKEEVFHRLGILRMDVDNLGNIFKSGFGRDRHTLSRYASLSRNLDWFFRGYINKIWNFRDKYKNNTFIIYSGGDDLFIVGKWNYIIEMATDINNAFQELTCNNDAFSLSGGIAVVEPKYPVKRSAYEAKHAEEQAKNHQVPNKKKNSFTIFDMPLNWNHEYDIVMKYREQIKTLLEEKLLPRSFISKMSAHSVNTKFNGEEVRPLNIYWQMAYDFGRMETRIKNAQGKDLLEQIKKDVFTNSFKSKKQNTHYHIFQLIMLATRLSELETKI